MAVTMGDPAGIGSEIILKSLPFICKHSVPVIIGDMSCLRSLSGFDAVLPSFKHYGEGRVGDAEFIDMELLTHIEFGEIHGEYGRASYRYIMEAVKLVSLGETAAIVTCPINKAAIRKAGIDFIGHTELLAYYGGVSDYVMMMANPFMRISLVTIHIPLKDVPRKITTESVYNCLIMTARSLIDLFGIARPFIKVCGLNPHAGENGLMGSEEKFIAEAVGKAVDLGIKVTGPHPADTLFHRQDCDAYVVMYHDQGLIPVKTVDFRKTVNITLGLPFIRTSPGHGTGYDIANKGIADPTSFIEAYRLSEAFAQHRFE
ncbi:MAG TPA: 4-hydroxythreonine-4-phosphate dehydrogenase PdxA [Syntrophorhabdaceae bacterium]|nr:4-hydroxythreonine-4-phosphate dehydrogenase PdxA [Syntrophorhabdaceae bacterium]